MTLGCRSGAECGRLAECPTCEGCSDCCECVYCKACGDTHPEGEGCSVADDPDDHDDSPDCGCPTCWTVCPCGERCYHPFDEEEPVIGRDLLT